MCHFPLSGYITVVQVQQIQIFEFWSYNILDAKISANGSIQEYELVYNIPIDVLSYRIPIYALKYDHTYGIPK
jgi:hypothetical protein